MRNAGWSIRLPARRRQNRDLRDGQTYRPAHSDGQDGGRWPGRPCWRSALTGRPSISGIAPGPRSRASGSTMGPGGLTLLGTVSAVHAPTFLAADRTGKYLLSCYYQGGGAAVHHLGSDGAVGAPSLDWLATATGAHAIATDPSNQFAFVPHIARLNDNVLEPPKENPGPNVIMQFRFDALPSDRQFAVAGRADRTPRSSPLLLSSDPGSRLLLQRAGLQRHRLSAGSCHRRPLCRANYHEPPRRVHRTEHLLPDTPDAVGAIPSMWPIAATTASPGSPSTAPGI